MFFYWYFLCNNTIFLYASWSLLGYSEKVAISWLLIQRESYSGLWDAVHLPGSKWIECQENVVNESMNLSVLCLLWKVIRKPVGCCVCEVSHVLDHGEWWAEIDGACLFDGGNCQIPQLMVIKQEWWYDGHTIWLLKKNKQSWISRKKKFRGKRKYFYSLPRARGHQVGISALYLFEAELLYISGVP